MTEKPVIEKYGRILQRSLDRFEEAYGYELRDPFESMREMLERGEPFSLARFGDGEFNAIFGAVGANCDGHRYFPELGQRLRQILESEPGYLLGLQPVLMLGRGPEKIQSVSRGIRWVLADSLHLASMDGRLPSFLGALEHRETQLVGPEHLRPLSRQMGWTHHAIPAENCWQRYGEVGESLRLATSGSSGVVVLFCASMMSNVLIDDLHRLNPANTYIDVGSVFDPYVGVNSRDYHDDLAVAGYR